MRALHAVLLAAGLVVATVAPGSAALASPRDGASLDRVGAWQAPTNATDFESGEDVRAAIDSGTLRRATGVGGNDTLVVGLRIRGFADVVSNASGSNTTARFLSAMSEHGDLEIRQTNPGPSQRPLSVHALDETGVRVFSDAPNNTYYVAVDLSNAHVTRGDDGEADDLSYGPYPFVVHAELAANSSVTEESQHAAATVGSRWAMIETAPDGEIHVRPTSNLTISGATNVGTGWPVTVVLTGDDDPETSTNESFQLTRNALVEASKEGGWYERTYNATVAREVIPMGAENVTLDVRFDDRSLLDEPIPVTIAAQRASVEVSRHNDADQFTGVSLAVNATLSAGGFLALHEGPPDGPVVGHTEYLDSGDHTVTVYANEPTNRSELVVVAHRDANHNEWFDGSDTDDAYRRGSPVEQVALSSTTTATATTKTASPTTATTTAPLSTVPTDSSSTDATSSSTTIPGFGALGTILALLLGLAVLKRR